MKRELYISVEKVYPTLNPVIIMKQWLEPILLMEFSSLVNHTRGSGYLKPGESINASSNSDNSVTIKILYRVI